LRSVLTRDHLSVISGITPEGRLFVYIRESAFDSAGVIGFLEHLLRSIPGKLLVIWDGATIHRSREIKAFLSGLSERGPEYEGRLQLERLPGYAPELNPDEGIWRHLKRVEMKNLCCRNLEHLKEELRKAVRRLRHKPHIVQSCFAHAGCV